ncbi:MAG: hypothetical protein IT342_20905 [Candidatus Melainabacteria bacterium]|nr:hypothetical protein [Candidatus Melainabacteria bacterium]
MPFVPELLLQETAHIGKAIGGSVLARELFSSPVTTKAAQVVEHAVSRTAQAGSATELSLGEIEQLYRTAPIEFAMRKSDRLIPQFVELNEIRSGVIKTGNSLEHVVVRPMANGYWTERRMQKELAAYAIHKESPFTNHFPITVARHDGNLLVQQRAGRSLADSMALIDRRFYGHIPPPKPIQPDDTFGAMVDWDRARIKYEVSSPGFRDLLRHSAAFRDQMEQSVAERLILGDIDDHKRNFTLLMRNGHAKVANIDFELAFGMLKTPPAPKITEFANEPLSRTTLTKVEAFFQKFDSGWGRSFLDGLGLNEAQVAALLDRSKWFLKDRHFPIA